MKSASILVVDDEPTVLDVVCRYLEREGYTVSTADTGRKALAAIERESPDLVVLDLMLPEMSGEVVCRRVRESSTVPIIMLTARDREPERLLGLELGADDYIVKPFSPRELVARVKAVLRRTSGAGESSSRSLVVGGLEIDPATREVLCDGRRVALTAKEFDLLYFLAAHAGQVFSREQLLAQVWAPDFEGDAATVTVHVRRLRSKIEPTDRAPRYLQTVWSVGYKFNAGQG
jgi:DNA-binding response OmpR family regulator